jgi:hypothetical protein
MVIRCASTVLLPVVFLAAAILLVASGQTSKSTDMQQRDLGGQAPATGAKPDLPQSSSRIPHAYHHSPPTGMLPPTLSPALLPQPSRTAYVVYSIAATIRELLYQEPCYCPCDRMEHHESLLDCYTSEHGLGCKICQKEVIFAFEQYKQGHSADEIRRSIVDGSWSKVDLEKFTDKHYSEYCQPADKR